MRLSVSLPAPSLGALPDQSVWEVPPNAAYDMSNIRVDGGAARSVEGYVALLDTPNTNRIIDLFNIQFNDGSVETIRCTRAATHRQNGSVWSAIGGTAWTATDADRFWCVRAPWTAEPKGRIIMCNGVDGPKSWTGGAAAMAAIGGASVPAKYATVGPDGRLFVANTIEGGAMQAQYIRWTVIGNANDWAGTGSGVIAAQSDQWPVTALWRQGGRIWYGKSHGIGTLIPTGIPTAAYGDEPLMSDGEGVFAPPSLIQFGEIVAFLAHTGFRAFDTSNLQRLSSERVERRLLSRLNYGALSQITSYIDAERGRVGWGLPLDNSPIPSEIWWYSFVEDKWEFRPLQHSAISLYTNIDVTTMDELTGTMNALAGTMDQLSSGATPKAGIIIGRNDGTTYQFDSTTSSDAGNTIAGSYTSGVLPLLGREISVAGRPHTIGPDDFIVLNKVTIRLLDRGQNYTLRVEASGDGGATWAEVGQLSLVSTASESAGRLVEKYATCRFGLKDSVQIRLSNITANVRWGWREIIAEAEVVGRKRT